MMHQNNYTYDNYNRNNVFTIQNDMCYDNKLMEDRTHLEHGNTTIPPESIRIPFTDNGRSSPKLKRKRRLRLRVPHVVNTVIVVVVTVFIFLLEFGYIPQTKFGYTCRDPSLSHAYKGDTISMACLLLGCILGPLIIVGAVELKQQESITKSCWLTVWKWYKESQVGLAFLLMFVEVAKVLLGSHRPHFLYTCAPNTERSCNPGEFITTYECTNDYFSSYLILDSSRSFPSGHSAAGVFVSIFCAVYIHYRLRTRRLGQLFKPFLIILCFLWGIICSLTRITDRRHHWWDVLGGTVIGVVCGVYVVLVFCKCFNSPRSTPVAAPKPSTSTTTLLNVDRTNKDSTSVIV